MEKSGRKIRVLVLEDDENLLAVLGQQLDQLGFSTDLSLQRSPAVEVVRMQEYDIVVSDINMPGLSLIKALDAIWKERPGLPVLLMTSGADPEIIAEARAKGARGPIVKPFRATDLAARIRVALQEKSKK